MAGYCKNIGVTVHSDNSISVEDDGRGIPVGIHKTENVPAVEVVLTKLHAGGKFDNDSYKVSGGLHGVGVSVVNALSAFLEVEVYADKKVYYQTYERGIKTSELKAIGKTRKKGTKIHFIPDADIFNNVEFNFDLLSRKLRELAFLNKGVKISILDERSDKQDEFLYKGGIVSFVEYVNRRHTPLHKPVFIEGERNNVQIEVAIQYNDTFTEKMFSFANNINTVEGGFHLIGFKAGLTRTLNNYSTNGNLPKNLTGKISGDDVREGLAAIISVRIMNPQFEGQTKTKLGNSEVKGLVESLINDKLGIFLEENPSVGKKIIAKAVDAARARDAAKRAREIVIVGAEIRGPANSASIQDKRADVQMSVIGPIVASLKPNVNGVFIIPTASHGRHILASTEHGVQRCRLSSTLWAIVKRDLQRKETVEMTGFDIEIVNNMMDDLEKTLALSAASRLQAGVDAIANMNLQRPRLSTILKLLTSIR